MQVVESKEEFPFPQRRTIRPDGLHIGTVIRALVWEEGIFNKLSRAYGASGESAEEKQDIARRHFEKGFLWEEVLSKAFGNRFCPVRPPPLRKDGIWCSPDGVSFVGRDMFLEEYKCTTISSTTDMLEKLDWTMQMKAYCYALGNTHAILRVLFLCGNRRKAWAPEYKKFIFTFTTRELEENWMLLFSFAKRKGWLDEVA